MIMIENKKTYRGEGIYIGRPSLLGNPFEIGVHGERGDVIRLYRRWLWNRILEQGEVYAELKRLARLAKRGDLTLIVSLRKCGGASGFFTNTECLQGNDCPRGACSVSLPIAGACPLAWRYPKRSNSAPIEYAPISKEKL